MSRRSIVVAAVAASAALAVALLVVPDREHHRPAPRLTPFAGTVRDLAGHGLTGGAVRSLFIGDDDEPRALGTVLTGPDGRYHMALDVPI
ncbi:MAG TPA: hypothetical protein VIX73_24055, partial [Kofleriaceae bacterium]